MNEQEKANALDAEFEALKNEYFEQNRELNAIMDAFGDKSPRYEEKARPKRVVPTARFSSNLIYRRA